MKIALGSDHGGYLLKNQIKNWLEENNYSYQDFGTWNNSSVDYPDIAFLVCENITNENCDLGIVICSSGVGISIACNKVKGIYCALVHNLEGARLAKEHNNSNVLALGAKFLDSKLALGIIEEWLKASFLGERHQNRIDKIKKYERS